MTTETVDNLIIGGGLSGIYAAYLLDRKAESFLLLEARERLGGRILCPEDQGFFTDLGPSWYWPTIHPKMARLISVLKLTGYRQFEEGCGRFQSVSGSVQTVSGYANEPQSWRLDGGMIAIIEKLSKELPENCLRLNHPVCGIEKNGAEVLVNVGDIEQEPQARFKAKRVILALPPRLIASTILFTPDLTPDLTQAMLRIGTWMAGQAKFYALYDEPFWRQAGLSGQAFSQRGPLGEIHDGSNNEKAPYGLTGFVGIPAVQRHNEELLSKAILEQLALIYGEPAGRPTAFFHKDWAREKFTATKLDQPPMYTHPLYAPPAGQASFWNNLIHFTGTETASQHGGYLEGALTAAARAVQ